MNWIYEKSDDNTQRYVLGTVGKRPLVCIGINPSTAEPDKLDPTLQSVARVSEANGYDSWIMLNVYPQRSTDPESLHKLRDHSICEENLVQIERILKEYNPTIWAAWGTNITKRPYLINCLYEIVDIANRYRCNWVDAGQRSKGGHPHHPLYLQKLSYLKGFVLEPYLKQKAIDTVFTYINLRDINTFKYTEFYRSLEHSEFLDYNYGDHLSSGCIDEELKSLKTADLTFAKALLTGILREDHFSNGSFEKRLEDREVSRVLRKLKSNYLNMTGVRDVQS